MGGGCRLGFARTCARGLSVVLRAGARRNIKFIQKNKNNQLDMFSSCLVFYSTIS